MSGRPVKGDYFDRVRAVAAGVLGAAGAASVVGSLMSWVTIRPAGSVLRQFGEEDIKNVSEPFTGIEAGDGWWVLGAGVITMVSALLLLIRKRAGFGWIGFLASIVIGAIAFADFRSVTDVSSGLSRRMDVVGDADPAFGLTLVAAAGVIGVLASAVGIMASPRHTALGSMT